MKKNKFLVFVTLLLLPCFLFACENATTLETAYFSNITLSGSKNYGIRIAYFEDSRLERKGTDVQFKCNKTGTLTFCEENESTLLLEVDEVDEWLSLTAVIYKANGKEGQEVFERYEDVLTKTYLWKFDGQIDITFRVVVGNITENSAGTGEILTETERISENFTLKIK